MASSGKRWTVQDRDSNPIYLTEERWKHIVEANNHPEMADYEDHLMTTIRQGRRRQEPLNPRKYRYAQPFDDLPAGFNHVVGIVLLGFDVNAQGETVPNNFIATAFLTHIRPRGG
jgi:hypothetical protein